MYYEQRKRIEAEENDQILDEAVADNIVVPDIQESNVTNAETNRNRLMASRFFGNDHNMNQKVTTCKSYLRLIFYQSDSCLNHWDRFLASRSFFESMSRMPTPTLEICTE